MRVSITLPINLSLKICYAFIAKAKAIAPLNPENQIKNFIFGLREDSNKESLTW